jgi:hypothetical protein
MLEGGWDTMRERIITSKKFQVGRLKTFSHEDRVSELYAWLARKMMIRLRQKASQKYGLEEFPHDVKVMKPGKGGGGGAQ